MVSGTPAAASIVRNRFAMGVLFGNTRFWPGVTALIDHTCGLAINSAFPTPAPIATLDLRIDYLRPAAPRAGVTCEAFGYKITRSIGFVRAEAWDADRSDLIATAQAAFMINPRG